MVCPPGSKKSGGCGEVAVSEVRLFLLNLVEKCAVFGVRHFISSSAAFNYIAVILVDTF